MDFCFRVSSLTASSDVGLFLFGKRPRFGAASEWGREWDYPTLEMLGLDIARRDVRRREYYIIPLRMQIMASWLELSRFNLAAISIC